MSIKNWLRFLGLGITWGTSFLWIKISLREISPFMVVGFRTLFGSLGLFFILLADKNTRNFIPEIRRNLKLFFVIGLINVSIPFLLIAWGQQYIDTGVSSILNSSVPLFSFLLAPIFTPDDSLDFQRIIGLVIGFLGIVLIMTPELNYNIQGKNLLGEIFMLLATLFYAIAGILIRCKATTLPVNIQAFLQKFFGMVIIWIIIFIIDRPLKFPTGQITLLSLTWLGFLGSCCAYIWYFALIKNIGPIRTATATYIYPMVGILSGVILLSEQIVWQNLVGGVMILSGIFVVNNKRQFIKKNQLK